MAHVVHKKNIQNFKFINNKHKLSITAIRPFMYTLPIDVPVLELNKKQGHHWQNFE